MFKCCGQILTLDDLKKEFNSYGLGDGSGETFLVCPICGDSPEEAYQCKDCGEWFTGEELTEGFCDNCLENIVNQYRYDIDRCISVCGDETQEIRISSFLASMFNEDQIEQILINELRGSQKTDCLPFITDDINWFLEQVKGVRQ